MKTIGTIALIDDDEIYQFTARRIIESTNMATKISSFHDGQEAIDFFYANAEQPENLPDIIFLDLNMPGLNGWEFLDKYFLLKPKIRKKIYIYIVTSSFNPDDLLRSKMITDVSGYLVKPLTIQKLELVVNSIYDPVLADQMFTVNM